MTLDIDATEIVAHKTDAEWTYSKNKGFMPMVKQITDAGQIVSVDFRKGNAPPAQARFEFIKQCQQALPAGCSVNALRIYAVGYQTRIIQYCDEEGIEYAIRAKMSPSLRAQIESIKEADWQPLLNRTGPIDQTIV